MSSVGTSLLPSTFTASTVRSEPGACAVVASVDEEGFFSAVPGHFRAGDLSASEDAWSSPILPTRGCASLDVLFAAADSAAEDGAAEEAAAADAWSSPILPTRGCSSLDVLV